MACPPELIHARLKRHARTGGRFLKDQPQHPPRQQRVCHPAALLHLELSGKSQQGRQLTAWNRQQLQEIFPETHLAF